jgi:hypothetical protein
VPPGTAARAEVSVRQRPGIAGMARDSRVEHLQRLHRQRRARATGHSRDTGRMLLALVLVSIILGGVLAVPAHEEVRAWVHHVSSSLQVDRVGMLPPPDDR